MLEHHEFVVAHAADYHGQIVQSAGDGYWLEFPSVTAAAKSAIAMQEALRLGQPVRGDDRLSIRIVIGVGDIAVSGSVLAGDLVPLMVRIETVTPADEIYLTAAAHRALASAEVQTAEVSSFLLKGFPKPITVYRVEQRHRTVIVPDVYILFSDLRGFTRLIETEPVATVERVLDTLDTLMSATAREFDGTIRYSLGDSYCVTYAVASQMVAAASRLSEQWRAASKGQSFRSGLNIALHRGKICVFRSFLYGDAIMVASQVQEASTGALADREGGVFVTDPVRDALSGGPWEDRLRPVALERLKARFPALKVYRLSDPWLAA
jgi:adenylate cyclase